MPSAGHAVKGGLGGKKENPEKIREEGRGGSQKEAGEIYSGWSGKQANQTPSSSLTTLLRKDPESLKVVCMRFES